jgi:hypothetical protein
MSFEPLASQMKKEYKKWAFSTKVYGTIYVIARAPSTGRQSRR